MPRVAGIAQRPTPPGSGGYVYNTAIDETVVNGEFNDIIQMLTDSLPRDGSAAATGNIPMGGNRLTNCGAATTTNEYTTLSQTHHYPLNANGKFTEWLYSGGSAVTTSGDWSADAWRVRAVGSTFSASRGSFTLGQTDVTDAGLYFQVCAVTTSAGAGNYCLIETRIPGVELLAGKQVTLSFYAKADASKNVAVEFTQYFGSTGSAAVTGNGSALYALTTSWAKKTVTVTLPSISGKTISGTDVSYTAVRIWMDAGSNFNSTTSSLGQQSITLSLADVKLEFGSVATTFNDYDPAVERRRIAHQYQIVQTRLGVYGTAGMAISGNAPYPVLPLYTPTATATAETSTNCAAASLTAANYGVTWTSTVTGAGAFVKALTITCDSRA